ncbi:MAG: RNA methyltransferase [Chloroflexus sp.]|jgi:23S rRNA G2445 N2-methylase RlmL|uniref:methyltransferase domain-containing protein n=1 Tax=Chloroflexus sp. TaxID=1904827 RepID=UPI0021DE51A6|nr:methyltransferase domain-containing protein [Chloroflexus sp.]GIV90214.1 MAG: RNA methyltransferase [Chloroflexus sp.]
MLYLLQTLPGLAALTWREVEQKIHTDERTAPRQVGVRNVPGRNDLILLDYQGSPRRLLELRTIEDVFVVATRGFKIAPDERGLRQIHAATRNEEVVKPALTLWQRLNGGKRNGSFRVVARMVGKHRFQRYELGRAVSDAIRDGWPGRWQPVNEEADLEVWATLIEQELIVAIRLSDASLRIRGKIAHLPASLRPALAATMVMLTQPAADDIFLDPMAGVGTILLERAAAGPFTALYGGDISPAAVTAMQVNLRGIHGQITIRRWNATKLPLPDASVTKVAVNLPFGTQIGEGEDLEELYRDVLRQIARVLKPGGRLVTLVANQQLLDRARTHAAPVLRATARHRVLVLGHRATICEHIRVPDTAAPPPPPIPAEDDDWE